MLRNFWKFERYLNLLVLRDLYFHMSTDDVQQTSGTWQDPRVEALNGTWWINPDSHTTHRDEFSFRDRSACIQDRELVAARQVVAPDALELTRLPVDACEFPVL